MNCKKSCQEKYLQEKPRQDMFIRNMEMNIFPQVRKTWDVSAYYEIHTCLNIKTCNPDYISSVQKWVGSRFIGIDKYVCLFV